MTMLVAALAPFVAGLVPGRAIPEVVFLVFAGALRPLWGRRHKDKWRRPLVSELGMAFLLMAGYEIKPSELVGTMGRHASICWGISLAAAIALVSLTGFSRFTGMAGIAFAIMLTTTAYGTLAPIMRARDLTNTSVGRARSPPTAPRVRCCPSLRWRSCFPRGRCLSRRPSCCRFHAGLRAHRASSRPRRALARAFATVRSSAGATTQTPLRSVVLLLVFLLFLAEVAGFDSVLGALLLALCCASFPDGSDELETRLEAIGNGFLIPAFFVISGLALTSRLPWLTLAYSSSSLGS